MRAAFAQRAAAISKLVQAAPGQVVAFSPVGLPGRWSAIRSTALLVDDVYALVRTSHVPSGPAATTALWTRLARPESMFAALVALLSEGGQRYRSPVWAGTTETHGHPADR